MRRIPLPILYRLVKLNNEREVMNEERRKSMDHFMNLIKVKDKDKDKTHIVL